MLSKLPMSKPKSAASFGIKAVKPVRVSIFSKIVVLTLLEFVNVVALNTLVHVVRLNSSKVTDTF